jgi:hypothetical protein
MIHRASTDDSVGASRLRARVLARIRATDFQTTAVKVELRSNGGCWEATYSTHITNDTGQFKAKSD